MSESESEAWLKESQRKVVYVSDEVVYIVSWPEDFGVGIDFDHFQEKILFRRFSVDMKFQ